MRKILLLACFISFNLYFTQTNEDIDNFEFYYGYKDYLNDAPVKSKVKGEIKTATEKYFKVSKFRYKDTDEKAKPENFTWAIKFNNDLYLSMWNAAYIYSDSFVKVDIVSKRYWVVFLNEKKDSKVIGANNPYGGGLIGAALNIRPRSSWKNKNGENYKILLIDFENPNITRSRPKDANAFLVDTKKILEVTNNDPEVIEKLKEEKYTIEDFANFIKSKI
ncbi:hypothetical protein [Flavobacterium sp. B17]|uniref:hypothetical protein n=1 Tax=Flavobacterium sp. B17 TaxID=95618 RepID=UPI0005B26123|nr:hypothetical protein [Flavobacterium sp. B17]